MGSGPSGWGLGVRLTTIPRKKTAVRKSEMWPRKGLMKRMQKCKIRNWMEQSGDRRTWRRFIMEEAKARNCAVVPMKKKILYADRTAKLYYDSPEFN